MGRGLGQTISRCARRGKAGPAVDARRARGERGAVILFELNVRLHHRTLVELADEHLARLGALGFDWIWLMGLWRIGDGARAISRRYGDDFEGSPYAVADYEVSADLGGESALRVFVERAHDLGIQVMADFVPNHMAVDSPLLDAHPDFAIHWNPGCRDAHSGDYFDHPRGRLAHGKDPYFAGWTDTAQLDYSHPPLRAHQIGVLRRLATLVDGVRCDMAMLVLREQVKKQWFPHIEQPAFDQYYREEFWAEAIRKVRADRPDFTFMAEVYWDKEPYLQQLGFDFTYDKKLHDLLAHGAPAREIEGFLADADAGYVRRSVHFLENHDEERAAVRFGARQRAAAILSFAIPGAVFVHQGEMEGRREKIPVQRRVPLTREAPDESLERFYAELLACVRDPLLRDGDMELLGVEEGVILILRRHAGRIALIGASPGHDDRGRSPALTLPAARVAAPADEGLRWLDLLDAATIPWDLRGDRVHIAEGAIGCWSERRGFVLELTGPA